MAWKFIFHAVDYPDSDIRNEKEAGNIRFSEGKQFEGFFFFLAFAGCSLLHGSSRWPEQVS